MRRILLILGLATLAGCVTTPDYRYVSAGGGYYTNGSDGYYAGADDGYYTGAGGYWSGAWSMAFHGGYGFGAWPYYGWGPGYAGYRGWGYGPYFAPYYYTYVDYHRRDRRRDRDELYREQVLQAGSASPAPARVLPRAASVQRESLRQYPLPASRESIRFGRGVQGTVPRGTPRSAPVTTPRSMPAPRAVPRSRPTTSSSRPLRRPVSIPVSRAPAASHATVPRGTSSKKSRGN